MWSFTVCTASLLLGCYFDPIPYPSQSECLLAGYAYRRQHPEYLHVACDWVGVDDLSESEILIIPDSQR